MTTVLNLQSLPVAGISDEADGMFNSTASIDCGGTDFLASTASIDCGGTAFVEFGDN